MIAALLKATDPVMLIEGDTWGAEYWGMTLHKDDYYRGLNNLGRLLMLHRTRLLGEEARATEGVVY